MACIGVDTYTCEPPSYEEAISGSSVPALKPSNSKRTGKSLNSNTPNNNKKVSSEERLRVREQCQNLIRAIEDIEREERSSNVNMVLCLAYSVAAFISIIFIIVIVQTFRDPRFQGEDTNVNNINKYLEKTKIENEKLERILDSFKDRDHDNYLNL